MEKPRPLYSFLVDSKLIEQVGTNIRRSEYLGVIELDKPLIENYTLTFEEYFDLAEVLGYIQEINRKAE